MKCSSRVISAVTILSVLSLSSIGCLSQDNSEASEIAANSGLDAPSTTGASDVLVPSTKRIDLGYIPPGGSERETLLLTNTGNERIEIAHIKTSCDCLLVEFPRGELESGAKAPVRVILDLNGESGFQGSLTIDIQGFDALGTQLFSIAVVGRVEQVVRSVLKSASRGGNAEQTPDGADAP